MLTRRGFLEVAAAAGVLSGVKAVAQEACGAKCCSDPNGSFRTQLKAALIDKAGDEATCQRVAAAGFKGVELTGEMTMGQARQYRANAEKAGIRIHSIMGAGWSDFNNADAEKRKASIEKMKVRLAVAAACGASTVLCVPGRIGGMKMPAPHEFSLEFDVKTLELKSVVKGDNAPYAAYIAAHNDATKYTIEAVRELEPIAAREGVTLCLENVWNNLWVKPDYMAALVRFFDSVWVKAYLDLGNHVCYAPAEEWLRAEKGIAAKLHIKDFLIDLSKGHDGTFVPIGKGSIDWKSVRKVIEETNYSGWISIESGGFSDAEHRKIMDKIFIGEGA
ncbi:MAG: sugar phosphate isomerase/epimerase [Kiritimatiellae bacterium]|nr:sugar phosphate isomerase/epimerase [Kiritimatiellia bacterium]